MNIIASKIITPDGTLLQSFSQHDCKIHDDLNGNLYGIDGGTVYQRIIGDVDDLEIICITDEDDFEVIRQEMYWGTYGKNSDQPARFVYLHEMSNDHIAAILDTQKHLPEWKINIFKKELDYRQENNIYIKDIK